MNSRSAPKPRQREIKPREREIKLRSRDPVARRSRKLMDFIEPQPNPLHGLPDDPSPERDFEIKAKALEGGLSAAVKAQTASFAELGAGDYYAVICFENGEQLSNFLKAIRYPDPGAMFLDGYELASLLGIDIPRPSVRLRPIRRPDKALARLVTERPRHLRNL